MTALQGGLLTLPAQLRELAARRVNSAWADLMVEKNIFAMIDALAAQAFFEGWEDTNDITLLRTAHALKYIPEDAPGVFLTNGNG